MFTQEEISGAKNVHLRFVELFEGLFIGGIGGAVPGIFKHN